MLWGGCQAATPSSWLFRRRTPPVKYVEEVQGWMEDIHGDVHALMNVVRSQHHQSRTTISMLVARLGKGIFVPVQSMTTEQ